MLRRVYVFAAVALAAAALACDRSAKSPASPSVTSAVSTDAAAAADGSTLKVSAPAAQSPVNDQQVDTTPVTLTASSATAKFSSGVPFQYRFQVFDEGGNLAADSGLVGSPSWSLNTVLDFKKRYTWRARAEYQGAAGPWSSTASFISPVGGFLNANGLYDPLNNGKTLGEVHGPVTFIEGVGVRLDSPQSYISYQLPVTLTNGEYSVLMTNVGSFSQGSKTKVFCMAEGYDDIVTNDRRFTIEKRGNGQVAWRIITRDDQIDTIGAERVSITMHDEMTYFWKATWGNNRFNLIVNEGGAGGRTIYDMGKGYGGVYDPTPHVIYLGSPPGRSGVDSQSIPGAVYRQVWVSNLPRPDTANQ